MRDQHQHNSRLIELARESNKSLETIIGELLSVQCIAYNAESQSLQPTPLGYLSGIFDKTAATTSTQLLQTTETHQVFIGYFDGNLMKFYKDLKTGEIGADLETMSKTLGYDDAHDLLSKDESLDLLNDCYKKTGTWPLKTI